MGTGKSVLYRNRKEMGGVMPKISVIIPVYKVEQYLRKCVDSVLSQTYTDLEVILVDDGSPDGCPVICDEYAARDSRVKVIHQENGGVSRARNAGLDAAAGEWLTFVDADDYIESTMYAQMLAVAEQTQVDLVETTYRYGKWDNTDTGKVYTFSGLDTVDKMFRGERYCDGFSVSPCTKLFRKATAGELRFLPGCTMAEDALYVTQFLCKAKTAAKLDKSFYNYYMSEDSAVRSSYRPNHCDEVDANEKIVETVAQYSDDALCGFLKRRYLGLIVHHWMRCRHRRSAPVFLEKERYLRGKFLEGYPKIKGCLSGKEQVKYGLFRWLPEIYYRVYGAYRGRKGK